MSATSRAEGPTLTSERMSVSSPTSNSTRFTPSRHTTSTCTSRTCGARSRPIRLRPRYILTEPRVGYRLAQRMTPVSRTRSRERGWWGARLPDERFRLSSTLASRQIRLRQDRQVHVSVTTNPAAEADAMTPETTMSNDGPGNDNEPAPPRQSARDERREPRCSTRLFLRPCARPRPAGRWVPGAASSAASGPLLDPLLRPVERAIYRVAGVDPARRYGLEALPSRLPRCSARRRRSSTPSCVSSPCSTPSTPRSRPPGSRRIWR